ncbi:hypothetical protein PPMP20_12500 [Paraburkholderia phymatum]|uniref:Glycosyl hydrolase family 32 N-terminal domain-containing protein n=1 Tax=Paraburkholderia phymatum (strain DSM 17167 / CIP 108236 / LMG 21445 / STM815) TaxID=391038 RepID=B2JFB0_PARP8|nr:hypothetical protein [Paraburkholderia phymatum]ACC71478.1 conserved hypothetical protein [Paraburkholderia phymatum STM815]
MQWLKRGLVYRTDQDAPAGTVRAMVPTPLLIDDRTIRIFLTVCDGDNVGRPYFVDVDASDPTKIIGKSTGPLMRTGAPGAFDERGIVCAQILRNTDGTLMMYYSGFERSDSVRYKIFMGLAKSVDNGESFVRVQDSPILGPTEAESMFRCAPFVIATERGYQMWYTAGSSWEVVGGKEVPRYSLKYLESTDGIDWASEGVPCMRFGPDEHGIGRPWITKSPEGKYQLYYSVRRISLAAYRLGYAESDNGLDWNRMDDQLGLDVSPGSFDSDGMSYTALINAGDKTYCFYNGNGFGRDGFAVAELIAP